MMSTWKKFSVSLLLCLLPVSLLADNCNRKSATFILQGDQYFNLNQSQTLTTKQLANIKKSLSSLKKRLKGNSFYTECDAVEIKERLIAETSLSDNGLLKIELEIHNVKDRSIYYETLTFFGDNQYQSFSKISKNNFSFNQKQRTGGINRGGVTLTEEFVTLKVINKKIIINMSKYQNGYYVFTRKMTLQP